MPEFKLVLLFEIIKLALPKNDSEEIEVACTTKTHFASLATLGQSF